MRRSREEGTLSEADDLVLEEQIGPIRRLTMNRPEVLNALSQGLLDALSAALARASTDDEARVIVIRGAGRAWSAGYDLKEEDERGDQDVAAWREELAHDTGHMLEIMDHPRPVIAEVHGYCLGGGCDLMMMCDFAIASDDAIFGEPEIRFGSGVVTMIMPWVIGVRQAKELLLTGDRVEASDALRMGLVNRVVPRARLEEETLERARTIAVMDPVAISHTKRAINRRLEVAGFREAVWANVDIDAVIEGAYVPERKEFNRIRAERGLKEAFRWRDERFR
jgi:enoyl-CoA hydratase